MHGWLHEYVIALALLLPFPKLWDPTPPSRCPQRPHYIDDDSFGLSQIPSTYMCSLHPYPRAGVTTSCRLAVLVVGIHTVLTLPFDDPLLRRAIGSQQLFARRKTGDHQTE